MNRCLFAAVIAASMLAAQEREAPPPLANPKPFAVPAGDTFTLNWQVENVASCDLTCDVNTFTPLDNLGVHMPNILYSIAYF